MPERPLGASGVSLAKKENRAMSAYASIYTANATKNWIWVTIYDLGKTTHLDYGWVEPGTVREWQSGNYLYGSFYYARGEVKAGGPEDTPNIFDTTVQVNPQDTTFPSLLGKMLDLYFVVTSLGKKPLPPEGLDTKGKGNVVILRDDGKGQYWWDHGN